MTLTLLFNAHHQHLGKFTAFQDIIAKHVWEIEITMSKSSLQRRVYTNYYYQRWGSSDFSTQVKLFSTLILNKFFLNLLNHCSLYIIPVEIFCFSLTVTFIDFYHNLYHFMFTNLFLRLLYRKNFKSCSEFEEEQLACSLPNLSQSLPSVFQVLRNA